MNYHGERGFGFTWIVSFSCAAMVYEGGTPGSLHWRPLST